MRRTIMLACLIASSLFATASFAQVYEKSTANMMDINAYVKSLSDQYGADKVLVVFDDDDTLTTMPQDLGGVAWYNWQDDMINHKAGFECNGNCVADNTGDLLAVQKIIFNMTKMTATNAGLKDQLQQFKADGIHTLVETARGDDMSNVTNQQLNMAGLVDKTGHSIFASNGPKLKNGTDSYPGYFPCPGLGSNARPLAYWRGEFYLAGQDKGKALQCLLNQAQAHYQGIVFVDDTAKNVDNVINAFKDSDSTTVYAVNYTKENAEQQDFLQDTARQQATTKAWADLEKAIKDDVPGHFVS